MKGQRYPRTSLGLDSWRIIALPWAEQTRRGQQCGIEGGGIFPDLFGSLPHPAPGIAPAFYRVGARGDEPVANLTGEMHRFRCVSGNVDRYGSASIHEFLVLVEEANHTPRFPILILYLS